MSPSTARGRAATGVSLVAWLVITFAAALVGSRFRPGDWYASLAKPDWTPPGALFAPVWTALYTAMAIAAWLVWRRGGRSRTPALTLYVVQLALNALWSYLFFGLHRPGLALLDIGLLWAAILPVMVLFWRIRAAAGALILPYLLWVSFAACLNFAIWRLNP
jgi:tryptophan-rich sensory protein